MRNSITSRRMKHSLTQADYQALRWYVPRRIEAELKGRKWTQRRMADEMARLSKAKDASYTRGEISTARREGGVNVTHEKILAGLANLCFDGKLENLAATAVEEYTVYNSRPPKPPKIPLRKMRRWPAAIQDARSRITVPEAVWAEVGDIEFHADLGDEVDGAWLAGLASKLAPHVR